MIRRLLPVIVAALVLQGCVVAPLFTSTAGLSVVSAGLGAGAAAIALDTEVLKVYDERHPPK